jgi:hypothetical protein
VCNTRSKGSPGDSAYVLTVTGQQVLVRWGCEAVDQSARKDLRPTRHAAVTITAGRRAAGYHEYLRPKKVRKLVLVKMFKLKTTIVLVRMSKQNQ